MPSTASDAQLGQAVLRFIQDGAYPDSEDVISAELPPSTFPVILNLVERARRDAKEEIRSLSRHSAGDIDGWIEQAKRLQLDIEKSKATAQEIIRHAEEGRSKEERVKDASSKASLLRAEVVFNETLAETLQTINEVGKTLDAAQEAAITNRLPEAIDMLEQSDGHVVPLRNFENTTVVKLVRQRVVELRDAVRGRLDECWDALMTLHKPEGRITLTHQLDSGSSIDVHDVTLALQKLGLLENKLDMLYQAIDNIILSPRLGFPSQKRVPIVAVHDDSIELAGQQGNPGIEGLFRDLDTIIDYLSTRLPPSIAIPLSQTLMPSLTSRMISSWLNSTVPASLDGMPAFGGVLDLVGKFLKRLESLDWKGTGDLADWVSNAPRVWLTKRRETSLDSVRRLLADGLGEKRVVERVETQTVARDESMLAANGEDDWNANWSDDGNEAQDHNTYEAPTEEEDTSAWGFDEEPEASSDPPHQPKDSATDDDEEDVEEAWGWRDDNQKAASAPSSPRKGSYRPQKSNGQPAQQSPTEQEMTLREKYTITALPDPILAIITTMIQDAETLASDGESTTKDGQVSGQPTSSTLPVASAGPGLFALPTLVLAMYRASASFYYANSDSGNMFLYNDSLWIAEQLRSFQAQQAPATAKRLKLDADASALENFGKRAYGKEMESQRTVIVDLLDGAQGFGHCTMPPFAEACDTAVAATVEHIKALEARWRDVLSRSALLQSLGSLLATATNKLIVDIEDMSDISEAESQRLATFCSRFSALDALFLPEPASDVPTAEAPEPVPLTAVYTPSWLRFQYLASILESSLVDIKYLWTEGELKLEFSAEEVIELIQALFADSEHRRKAIAEIRRSRER